jgi:hypothetical protein
MKLSSLAVAVLASTFSASSAHAVCSSYPYTLTNGTPADATQVMANFNCAALSAGSTLDAVSLTGTSSLPTVGKIVNDGTLIIGGNTHIGGTAKKLSVYQSASQDGITVAAAGSGSGGTAYVAMLNNVTQNIGYWFFGGSNVGSISSNGSSTAYNTTSDARLKSVAATQKNYRSIIQDLWVGDFEWKKTHKRDFGILAQQTYAVFPTAVTRPSDEAKPWQADYGKLSPLALWGVKDLYKLDQEKSQRIEDLEQRLVTLSKEILRLRLASASVPGAK